MRPLRPREGDLIETFDHAIFDVKGLVHPPGKVIAFIRYVPDPKGDRRRDGEVYRKVYPLEERYELLRQRYPHYLFFDDVFDDYLNEVPMELVKHHYNPLQKPVELRNRGDLDEVERQALELIELLKERSNIPWGSIGITGSILLRLHHQNSDIDPIIYGSKNCSSVYEALREMHSGERGPLRPYETEDLKRLYKSRLKDTIIPFKDFLRNEKGKLLQGKFGGRDYFIRFVKDWDEVKEGYGEILYRSMGYARVVATVVDASEAIFTPCRYEIDDVRVVEGRRVTPIKEIASFRGRFCEQASPDERIEAQGKLEMVSKKDGTTYYRLLLGGRPTDYMRRTG